MNYYLILLFIGFIGFIDISYSCPENCKKCYNGYCRRCKTGFWGDECENNCPENCLENICNIGDGYCECKHGYYGDNCEKGCSTDCLICDKETGICLDNCYDIVCSRCKRGFYGELCNMKCPKNCFHCNKNSGKCL